MDLCDVEGVNQFVDWYADTHNGRLDVLIINNAGTHRHVLTCRKVPVFAVDGTEIHWRTNYLGTFHLTHRFLPLLRNTADQFGEARVVNVSSHLHDRARNDWLFNDTSKYDSWTAYGRSKLALIHLRFELHRRYFQEHVHSYVLHPGSAWTNLTHSDFEHDPRLKRIEKLTRILERLVLLHPHHGAQTTIMCATKNQLGGGRYFFRCAKAEPAKAAQDAAISKRLWDESEKWQQSITHTQ